MGVLLFFSVNLLASAAPEKAQLALPEKFAALDPDGKLRSMEKTRKEGLKGFEALDGFWMGFEGF